MSHARVRKLFSAALAEWAADKNIPVSYDNVVNTFDMNQNHVQSHIIPSDSYSDTLGGDILTYTGIFQLKVITKYGVGMLDSEEYIRELQEVFKLNKRFEDDNGFAVQVVSPIFTPEGKQVGAQLVVPSYFTYRADTIN